jgi:hypothetical protein
MRQQSWHDYQVEGKREYTPAKTATFDAMKKREIFFRIFSLLPFSSFCLCGPSKAANTPK